jgi:hypothetical protein
VEVAEKRVFFGQKWLKNVHFSGGSGLKTCIFGLKWLKNVRFSDGSG